MHIHTYIHMHIHTYIHMHIHTTYICTYIHTYICTYIHTYIHTYAHTYIHTYICTYIHTYIHTYIRTYIHTRTLHTHTRRRRFTCYKITRRKKAFHNLINIMVVQMNTGKEYKYRYVLQWNPSMRTLWGPVGNVLITEVSTFQRVSSR